jgi:hypothetical protein
MITNYNESLSARIIRRNKQGFKGTGTETGWVKTSEYGNLAKKPVQNKYQNIVNFLRKHLHKRCGTKKAKTLLQYV